MHALWGLRSSSSNALSLITKLTISHTVLYLYLRGGKDLTSHLSSLCIMSDTLNLIFQKQIISCIISEFPLVNSGLQIMNIYVRFLAWAVDFSVLCSVHTGCGTHPVTF
jgi:hypothetical protein